MNDYYVYAFLREDRYSPYYIGKGRGRRYLRKEGRCVHPPTDRDRVVKVKENLTEVEAFALEVLLIKQWGDLLYNQTEGGEGVSGHTHSAETKSKIGEASKNAVRTEEWKENISKALTGKKLSEEHKRKIAKARSGQKQRKRGPLSQEVRDKVAEGMRAYHKRKNGL